jgi:molecular chaperone HtpG
MGQFKGKSFVSIARDEFDLSQFADTAARANTPADAALGTRAVAAIKAALGDMVEDVRASDKLVNSPARLVAGSGGLDFNLERILKAQNPEFEGSKKVLEINAGHDLVAKISTLEGDVQAAACRILFEQARLLDGEMPTDPKQFQLDFATLAQRL